MSEDLERAMESDRWNVTTLHEHMVEMFKAQEKMMNTRFDAEEAAVKAALASAEKAVEKAEILAKDHFEQQNEWRGTVNDLIQTMMPRAEYEAAHANVLEKTDALAQLVDNAIGAKIGASRIIAYVIAALGMSTAVITLVVHFLAR